MRHIDIIVPIYRNAHFVRRCLDSLIANIPEISHCSPRLMLFNDSPHDEEVAELLGQYNATQAGIVQIFTNAVNKGFVQTVNNGLERALADDRDVLLVNSDTITFAGTLPEILRVAASDPQVAFVSPRSNNAALCTLPHQPSNTRPRDPASAHQAWKTASRTMPQWQFVPTAVGFYLFIAHHILANIGLLKTEFGAGYEEENDLIMRAGKVGYRAALANHAFAYHEVDSPSFTTAGAHVKRQKKKHLEKLNSYHREFTPLVRVYEASPVYRAERLLSGLIAPPDGRLEVALDLRCLGRHHNGTNDVAALLAKHMAAEQSHRFRVSVIASAESLDFHGIVPGDDMHVTDAETDKLYAVAIAIRPPYDIHDINLLEKLAPINLYMMHDTISEDCSHLAVEQRVFALWDHVARTASGLLFNSQFTETTFCTRHPTARRLPRLTKLFPTRLGEYSPTGGPKLPPAHVLIVGNSFPHKGLGQACDILARAFPKVSFVVLGECDCTHGNVECYPTGTQTPSFINRLFVEARAVVLPSFVEGFGFGIVRAIAAGRPVVARAIPATREILETYVSYQGVCLFRDNREMASALALALELEGSSADDNGTLTWADWVEELAGFCMESAQRPDIYSAVANRIDAGDLLRAKMHVPVSARKRAVHVRQILKTEGNEFIRNAYESLLRRAPDPEGNDFYLRELARGVSKLDILKILANSEEGTDIGASLAGLRSALRRQRWRDTLRAKVSAAVNLSSIKRLRSRAAVQVLPPNSTCHVLHRQKRTDHSPEASCEMPQILSDRDAPAPPAPGRGTPVEDVFEAMRSSEMNSWVGGADPEEVGRASFAILREYLAFGDDSHLLDFGCGIGRVSLAVLDRIPAKARLTGLDIIPQVIRFCRSHIAPLFPNASFELIRSSNSHYDHFIDPAATGSATSYPQAQAMYSDQFSAAYAFSVFTHVDKKDFLPLLKFLSQVTRRGGVLLFSCFILNPRSRDAVERGKCLFSFDNPRFEDNGSILIGNSSDRLSFIAYDENLLRRMVRQAGLVLKQIEYGRWSNDAESNLQDIVVCHKP